MFGGDNFAFIATLTGAGITASQDSGIWVGSGEAMRAIGREGEDAPGASGAKFGAFISLAIPGGDAAFFSAKLKSGVGGVTKANGNGLWISTQSGTRLALREGQSIDLGRGVSQVRSFELLSNVSGSAGHGRYDAQEQNIDALIRFADGSVAIATIDEDASVALVALSGQKGQGSRTPINFGSPSSPGKGELPVALTTFQIGEAGFTKENNLAVFDFADNAMLAQRGAPAPGIEGGTFKSFQNPVAGYGADAVRVTAFVALVQGATAADDAGLWEHRGGPTPSLELVAREGSEPPGAPGTRFKSFDSISMVEGRGTVFIAKLASGSNQVNANNDRGLWATDSKGFLGLLIREGQAVDSKTLRSFSLLKPCRAHLVNAAPGPAMIRLPRSSISPILPTAPMESSPLPFPRSLLKYPYTPRESALGRMARRERRAYPQRSVRSEQMQSSS